MKLFNKTKNKILAEKLEIADNFSARTKGLLGRQGLSPGEGLHITRCDSIHSFFMRFSFDAVFIDKKNIVCGLEEKMQPWRVKFCVGAKSVIELPAGAIALSGTEKEDLLEFLI